MSVTIQRETRLAVVLEAHPELEQRLMTLLPAVAALQNETLRKSVLEGTTLEQAARVAGLPAGEFIETLRAWTGGAGAEEGCGQHGHAPLPPEPRPEWAARYRTRFEIDADEMLATGVHPAGKVRQCAGALERGEMVALASSFCPSPLVALMREAGFAVWTGEEAPGRWRTLFALREA